jgi:broad specificity phosphatase PhoE
MTTVVLVRHGRTRANREGVFRGRMDVPLDGVGREQARATGNRLKDRPLAAIYASPLSRARDTAEAVARHHDLKVQVDEAFDNLELGPWTGRRRAEVAREDPDRWRLWVTRPEELRLAGAETLGQVAERSAARLGELVRDHAGEEIVVVAHRAVIKPLLARVLGLASPWFWRFALDPGSVSVLTHLPDRGYTLTLLNETGHLRGEPGSPDDA